MLEFVLRLTYNSRLNNMETDEELETTQLMHGLNEFATYSSEVRNFDPVGPVWFDTTNDSFFNEINYTVINSWLVNTSTSEKQNTPLNIDVFCVYPRGLLWFGAACFIAFTIIGILGNFISILALSRCIRLRNATTAFIVNLCVADLLFCSFSNPLSAIQFIKGKGYLSVALCKLFPLIQYPNAFVSIMSIIAITMNRYILVVHPKFYPSVYNKRNTSIMIALIWLMPVALLMFPLLEIWGTLGYDPDVLVCTIVERNDKSPKVFLYIIAFGLPSVTFIVCYTKIFFAVHRASERAIRHSGKSKNFTSHLDSKELRVLRVMLVIFLLFVV